MIKLSLFPIILLTSLLVGCSTVYSTKPVGVAPASIQADDWQGTWVHKDGAITIEVVDAEKGLLQAALIEDMKLKSFSVHIQTSGDWMFGSTKQAPDDKRFVWGRVKREENQLIIWSPSVSKFKTMVQDGVLPGVVQDGGNVTLGELTTNHINLIASEANGVVFDWDEPVVFTRLSK